MSKEGVLLKSMYIVDFKNVKFRTKMAEEMMIKMLDEMKHYDKRKFLERLKPKEYYFKLRIIIFPKKKER